MLPPESVLKRLQMGKVDNLVCYKSIVSGKKLHNQGLHLSIMVRFGTETKALDALLKGKTPKNLPKSKSISHMNYPSSPAGCKLFLFF